MRDCDNEKGPVHLLITGLNFFKDSMPLFDFDLPSAVGHVINAIFSNNVNPTNFTISRDSGHLFSDKIVEGQTPTAGHCLPESLTSPTWWG